VRDALVTLGLSLGLALLVTGLLSTAYGLLWRPRPWRAPLLLLLPIMAPIWAFQERMFLRSAAVVLGALLYALCAWEAFRIQ
jgi:hypothetical protein